MAKFILESSRKELLTQLKHRGITDGAVLAAIEKVPRECFVHTAFIRRAYEDSALPIGDNQTISQPFTVAYMTQLLKVQSGQKILEVGTGSGYQCAVLAAMGATVYTIERHEKLHSRAKLILGELYKNVHCLLGDGSEGLSTHAPFDRIIVTAGAPEVPRSLIQQLAIGGLMVVPVGDSTSQKMVVIERRSDSGFDQHWGAIEFRFVPLLGSEGWKAV